jgi:hypothetical protein
MSKQSNQELRHGTQRFLAAADLIARIITSSIKWGALLGIAYFASRAIESLSGQTTLANFALNFLGDVKINQYVYLFLTGGGGIWALNERRLRRNKVAELANRIKTLENLLDGKRSSSMLPPSGTTRAED